MASESVKGLFYALLPTVSDFIFLPFWKRANEPEKLVCFWWHDEILFAARRRSAIGASIK